MGRPKIIVPFNVADDIIDFYENQKSSIYLKRKYDKYLNFLKNKRLIK